ncbi:MAG TPA: ATP-binding cassette domain-containing protein [Actinomycetota bacterium]|nr:ATP-binding cassette domain-containing protein [Actinomycetota bacterium]
MSVSASAEASEVPARTSRPAIEIRGLRKRYGDVEAVQGIDLEVPAGELFGFLGPNGAGKSTTIKILCTLVRPTSGDALVAGYNVVEERNEVRRHIGLVFQEPTLDEYLTAEQNLRFHAEIYGIPRAAVAPRLDSVLEMIGLADRRKDKVANFSGGLKRRLEIGRGLLHSPRVLFLDEPTIGLDPQSRVTLWKYVDQLRVQESITVFLTTHYMDEAERCDRIAIIDQGRIVVLGTPAGLKASVGQDRIRMRTANDQAAAETIIQRLGVRAIATKDGVDVFTDDGEGFVPRIFELGLSVQSVTVTKPTLDDVFLAYTGNRIDDAPSGGLPPGPWSRKRG